MSVDFKIKQAGAALFMLVGFAGAANAGSLDTPQVDPQPMVSSSGWEGYYAGTRLGFGFAGDDEVGHRSAAGILLTTPGKLALEGGLYGLRMGWRREKAYRNTSVVFGGELSYERGNLEDSFDKNGYEASSKLDNLWGMRFKVGGTTPSRETLFYGILGYARAEFDYEVAGATGAEVIDLDTNTDLGGYIVGLGVEHKLSDPLSVTAEWEFMEFGSTKLTDSAGAVTSATPKFQNFSIGLNYSF